MRIFLRHETGLAREVKLGFSWTTLFFGFFVPFVRGDLKWGGILLAVELLAVISSSLIEVEMFVILPALVFAIMNIVMHVYMGFNYNRIFIKELLEKGYKPTKEKDEEAMWRYLNK